MIYDIKAIDNIGNEISMSQYKNKVILIVNTATQCGLTPQYEGLQKLYEKYYEQGFEVLEFPCNQFLEQAPGTDDEIDSFCVLNFATTFKRFSKINVNGEEAHELFKYLREEAPDVKETITSEVMNKLIEKKGFKTLGNEIKWNFTKFLVDRNGTVVKRFLPTDKPKKISSHIEKLLKQTSL